LRFLTDFADLAVLLPLALCIGLGLALAGWRRGAAAWGVALVGALATMLFLKLLLLGCGSASALSPSGHTAAGTTVYGGAAALWLRRWLPPVPAALLGGCGVAALIGVSRIAIHAHLPIEVVIGAAVGLAAILVLLLLAGPRPVGLPVRWLIPAAVAVALLLHGTRLQAEPRLRAMAGWLPAAVCKRLTNWPSRPVARPSAARVM
jgi:membrane-associated phospholipid phosphatase